MDVQKERAIETLRKQIADSELNGRSITRMVALTKIGVQMLAPNGLRKSKKEVNLCDSNY
jgi:hypothetical protein